MPFTRELTVIGIRQNISAIIIIAAAASHLELVKSGVAETERFLLLRSNATATTMGATINVGDTTLTGTTIPDREEEEEEEELGEEEEEEEEEAEVEFWVGVVFSSIVGAMEVVGGVTATLDTA